MCKIVAVIVTYNRLEKLKKCMACFVSQTRKLDAIVVVNNASTDGTKGYLDELKENSVVTVHLEENTGGAGGFAIGIETAMELQADWIWGMDDDAFPEEHALEKIVCASQAYKHQKCCFWSNCNHDFEFQERYKEVGHLMFVGFFISRALVNVIGLPRADFFIYYDDLEYSQRIRKSGYSIIKVRDSVICHNDSASNQLGHLQIGRMKCEIVSCPQQGWRVYYWVRNDILRYSYKEIKKYYQIFIHCPVKFIKICIFAPKNIPIFLEGLWDGIRNISGKRELT